MHKINYITYIIFIVLLGIIRAQYNDTPRPDKAGVIRGMVVDEITGKPKAYASISILKDKLIEHLDENKLLVNTQHELRSRGSCQTNLLEYTDNLTRLLDDINANDVISLDFSKAFGKVANKG